MGWCLECHREPEKYLVDVDGVLDPENPVRITDLATVEKLLNSPDQRERLETGQAPAAGTLRGLSLLRPARPDHPVAPSGHANDSLGPRISDGPLKQARRDEQGSINALQAEARPAGGQGFGSA